MAWDVAASLAYLSCSALVLSSSPSLSTRHFSRGCGIHRSIGYLVYIIKGTGGQIVAEESMAEQGGVEKRTRSEVKYGSRETMPVRWCS